MDIDHFEPPARPTPPQHETDSDSSARAGRRALRAGALRQLLWQQREWERVLAAHTTGTPCLVAASERANLHDSLDLLRQAREDVPSWLYGRGSLVRTTDAAGGIVAEVILVSLLADITRVLAWFDSAPRLLGASIASAHPWVGADAADAGDDSRARVHA
jgi:hypothetical protein